MNGPAELEKSLDVRYRHGHKRLLDRVIEISCEGMSV